MRNWRSANRPREHVTRGNRSLSREQRDTIDTMEVRK